MINIFLLAISLMVVDALIEELSGASQGNNFLYDGPMVDILYLFIMVPLFVISVGLIIPDWAASSVSGKKRK